jgi:riboflavin synthase
MFTGLVEEKGTVASLSKKSDGIKIKINCSPSLCQNSKIGDSIATNGVCLTAVEIGSNYFVADVMNESIKRSNLKSLNIGDSVNLEKSLTLQTPLGGHLVTGDIDCEGKIVDITSDGFAKIYRVALPQKYMKYVVEKGRVALDGASLTVVEVTDENFTVSLIPHTQKAIILGEKKIGDFLNVETDLFGKFVERILYFNNKEEKNSTPTLDAVFLAENGFF